MFLILGNNKVKIHFSSKATSHFNFPKYNGESNAFVIEYFAIDTHQIDEKLSSFDFLKAAFSYVPEKDYCILVIPTDLLPFPLLDLFVVSHLFYHFY